MRELAVQAANDTNIDTDRDAIKEEMDALRKEITRISEDTEFNNQSLLNGDFDGTFQIGANDSQSISLSINNMNSPSLGLTSAIHVVEEINMPGLADGVYTVNGPSLLDTKGNSVGTVVRTSSKVTVNGQT